MSPATTSQTTSIKVQKRNGQIVNFNPHRVKQAIENSFKDFRHVPREAELSVEEVHICQNITNSVLEGLHTQYAGTEATVTVETIQDEVVRHLHESGYKKVSELYANYRKQHASRRSLFELYTTKKRDGKIVSFKPEKITLAIAKAFRACNQGVLSEHLLDKAKDLADGVIVELRTIWPDGRCVTIEEIQDLVEKHLFKAGYHDVVRYFVQYREKRARHRRQQDDVQRDDAASAQFDWLENVMVADEKGEQKPINVKEIRYSLGECCDGLKDVDPDRIIAEAAKNYFNGITKDKIALSNIMAAKSFIEKEPNYAFVAARLLLLTHYEETLGHTANFETVRMEYPVQFSAFIRKSVDHNLLSADLLKFDLDRLGQELEPRRDFLFRYMGLQILHDRYFIHWEGRRLELPQMFWMRVAMGLAKEEGPKRNERAIEFYHMLSSFRFISSTPTLFNSGTPTSQLSSCFLTTVYDDLEHIFKCIQDDAMLSKWSGGLGNDWTNVRAMGSRIKGTNGKSQGVIPFLKVANDTALAVNQGGKRQGAMCAYLEIWHLDFEEFLDLRKNTGDDRRRTHDMHTAAWIPDLFMKRVKENGNWTLFSPVDVPDLHDLYGKAFEEKYVVYEAQAAAGKLPSYKTMPAVALWRKVLNMLFETGHPWLTWKDPSNIRSAQDHTGVVHSSNLCTEILLNTSDEETAVCNLGSINLAAHTTPDGLDMEKLKETVRVAIRMLDNVIDINYYPTIESKRANQKHRPIGLGLMGFQDALLIQNISYASNEAVEFADRSTEAISYYAMEGSIELAQERGAYSTFRGSKWDRGLLPIDTLKTLEDERGGYVQIDTSATMDWDRMRERVREHGLRNSQLMAIAPTATIGNIIGVTASIEPLFKNIFVKSNLSGEFTVINEYLVRELKAHNLWDDEMINDLKYFDGSIQEIPRIPVELKQKYVTAFEIEYEWIIESASRRQKWIDMGQSLNLYQAKPSGKKVSQMYMLAWERGLKTTYYLRSMGATRIEKSTLDITKYNNVVGQRERNEFGKVTDETRPAPSPNPNLSIEPKEDCEACQ